MRARIAALIGRPYRWPGRGTSGFDSSGLVARAWTRARRR